MKAIQKNPHIIESSDGIRNILLVMDVSLILFNNFVSKSSKYTAAFLSIDNETF